MARVTIVTGAARGIRAATTIALAAAATRARGRAPAPISRRSRRPGGREELDAVVAAAGPNAHAVAADATDVDAMADVVVGAEHEHGGLDVIVAAAG